MKKEIFAIYGGTFSPPHNGHVRAAEAFSKALSPDRFLVIVDNLPPHKEIDGGASAEHRLAMASLAFGHIPNVEISDMEIRRGGRSYTAETLTELSAEGRELYFLCGTDMFLSLLTWRCPEVIFEKAVICLVRRESDAENDTEILRAKERYESDFSARILLIDASVTEVSSTELRRSLTLAPWLAASILPPAVLDYIRKNGLWQMNEEAVVSSLREDIRRFMSEKRYRHTLGVEKMAIRLAAYFLGEVDLFHLRVASLLHDITKELSEQEQRDIVAKMQIKLSESQKKSPAIFHSFTAEYRIFKEYSCFADCDDVIRAIRAHTTGDENMSLLDKILFVSDYIEEGREYPRSIFQRERIFSLLEKGERPSLALDRVLLSILESTVEFLGSRGYSICENTLLAKAELLTSISSN